jgi:hypothetical protein
LLPIPGTYCGIVFNLESDMLAVYLKNTNQIIELGKIKSTRIVPSLVKPKVWLPKYSTMKSIGSNPGDAKARGVICP